MVRAFNIITFNFLNLFAFKVSKRFKKTHQNFADVNQQINRAAAARDIPQKLIA